MGKIVQDFIIDHLENLFPGIIKLITELPMSPPDAHNTGPTRIGKMVIYIYQKLLYIIAEASSIHMYPINRNPIAQPKNAPTKDKGLLLHSIIS